MNLSLITDLSYGFASLNLLTLIPLLITINLCIFFCLGLSQFIKFSCVLSLIDIILSKLEYINFSRGFKFFYLYAYYMYYVPYWKNFGLFLNISLDAIDTIYRWKQMSMNNIIFPFAMYFLI